MTEQKKHYDHADTLRGSITQYREGWDVLSYELDMKIDIANKAIAGCNIITYFESLPVRTMQIDLQSPMIIDSIVNADGNKVSFSHDGNVWLVKLRPVNAMIKFLPGKRSLKVYYHGIPRQAKNAPWDGGVVWTKDSKGNPFIGVAAQGIGASVWWPCKDHQSDEPDSGVVIKLTVPDTLSAVSNGRLKNISTNNNHTKTWKWSVTNPINAYEVTMNIGKYTNWSDTLMGVDGKLDLSYWVLKYDADEGERQFEQVKPMLRAFEYWFGKYPWYEDGYKLVEAPFLGLENQSAVAYGNGFKNGYKGRDISGTGWGLNWDFIIVHESGHEWFGNNITSKDIADMWIHEGFTNYSEVLYTETYYGKKAANEYCYGLRKNIRNDIPVIGIYGVNEEGSTDMYYKASNMLHAIRHSMHNDSLFINILHGLNKEFYHQTVTTQQVETYISNSAGFDYSKVFDQYLRTTKVPVLQFYFANQKVYYKYTNCVEGFNLPIYLEGEENNVLLHPTDQWQSTAVTKKQQLLIDRPSIEMNYYVSVEEVERK